MSQKVQIKTTATSNATNNALVTNSSASSVVNSSSLIGMASQPAISAALILLYNLVMENEQLTSRKNITDCFYMALSTLAANLANQYIIPSSVNSMFNNINPMLPNYVIEPLLASFSYSYLYNSFLTKEFSSVANRNNTKSMIVGFVVDGASQYLTSPLYNLLLGANIAK